MSGQSLPFLDVAQDPARMQAVLQRYLQPAGETPIEVMTCNVDFVRPTPGHCLLQYTVGLFEPATGRSTQQVVTGVMLGGERGRSLWQSLQQTDPAAKIPVGEISLLPVTYVPELDLLVQVFPYDHHLPALRDVLNGAPPVVAALLPELDPERWEVEKWDAAVVRYRPDLRAMIRVELQARAVGSGRRATLTAFAKVYREDEAGQRAAQLLQTLWDRTSTGDLGFTVARPIAYIAPMRALIIAEVPGRRLLDIVRHDDEVRLKSAIQSAGRAVADLHQLPLPEGTLPAARRDEQARLASISNVLRELDPQQAAAIDAVAAAIAASLVAAPPAPTHFDLKPGNILYDGERVALLDFDKLAWGDPLIDVANLMASLDRELGGERRRRERSVGMARLFAEAYLSSVPHSWWDRLRGRYALAILSEAATTGRGLRGRPGRANRNGRVVNAVDRAQNALHGNFW